MPTKRKPPAELELRRQVRALRQRVRELLDGLAERDRVGQAAMDLLWPLYRDEGATLAGVAARAGQEIGQLRQALESAARERDEARAELALAINGLPRALKVPEGLPDGSVGYYGQGFTDAERRAMERAAVGKVFLAGTASAALPPDSVRPFDALGVLAVDGDGRVLGLRFPHGAPQTEQRTRYMREVPRG